MTFIQIYFQALLVFLLLMFALWLISIYFKNTSIVDFFWGLGFVVICAFYFVKTVGFGPRKFLLMFLVATWGIRLSSYLIWRSIRQGEDLHIQNLKKKIEGNRLKWILFLKTCIIYGILMWLISAPLLGAQFSDSDYSFNILDLIGFMLWIAGMIFETVADIQMARFKTERKDKNRLMDRGLWKYCRHPNYFGDAMVWWGYGFLCLAAGSDFPVLGSVLMTFMIVKVSGVAMLEKNLKETKLGYADYMSRTNAFFPWFPKK
ncbi:MAG: DUF1295 domain-containing protein [Bacteroidota bacterium]|nr:DUF1295 domain-containing protein [Bacteroidota bacterium]